MRTEGAVDRPFNHLSTSVWIAAGLFSFSAFATYILLAPGDVNYRGLLILFIVFSACASLYWWYLSRFLLLKTLKYYRWSVGEFIGQNTADEQLTLSAACLDRAHRALLDARQRELDTREKDDGIQREILVATGELKRRERNFKSAVRQFRTVGFEIRLTDKGEACYKLYLPRQKPQGSSAPAA